MAMRVCRRPAYSVLGAIVLLALTFTNVPGSAQTAITPDMPFAEFLAQLRSEAIGKGIVAATLDKSLAGLSPDPEVLELLNRQPEHDRSAGQYVSLLVSAERIANGRARLAEHAAILADIEKRFAVDRHVLVAIWGVETSFGTAMGGRSIVRSLATLAHGDPRRPLFWRGELLAALRILQNGDIAPEQMTGSWAGAMGHTQFMPTTFQQHAVDFDKDGRRDIWGNVGDAVGSTASYLKASGWSAGQPWGFEVALPAGFDYGQSAPGKAKRAGDWQALGVKPTVERPWPATTGDLTLLLPAGANGPAFLVTTNFRAILRYNASTAYALAVGLLADALATGIDPQVRWPEGDKALARSEREELQRLLSALGHDTGNPDGIIGSQTRNALRTWQRTQALPEDGHASPELLERLRSAGK